VNRVKKLEVLAWVIGNSEIQSVSLIDNTLSAISYVWALTYIVYDTLTDDDLVFNPTFEPDFAAAFAVGLFDFKVMSVACLAVQKVIKIMIRIFFGSEIIFE